MLVRDRHGVQYLGIDGFVFQIDDVHLLSDALERSFGAQSGEVGTNIPVRVLGNPFQINLPERKKIT